MLNVRVTYTVFTHESVENGESAEGGFMCHGIGDFAWAIPLEECDDPGTYTVRMSGRDAVFVILGQGCTGYIEAHGGRASFYPHECQKEDYSNGDRTEYVVHVDGDPRLVAALARHVGQGARAARRRLG